MTLRASGTRGLRVLLVTDHFLRTGLTGGGEVTARKLHEWLPARGHRVAVACAREPGPARSFSPGVFPVFSPRSAWSTASPGAMARIVLGERLRLSRLISGFRPDVLYCLHLWGVCKPTIAYLNSLRVPQVYRFGDEWPRLHYRYGRCSWYGNRSDRLRRSALFRRLDSLLHGTMLGGLVSPPPLRVRAALYNGGHLRDRIAPSIDASGRAEVVPNGVDVDRFRGRPARTWSELRLLYVGRLVRIKGAHILIRALAHVLRSPDLGTSARLTIVGASPEPDYARSLHALAGDLGLRREVDFAGNVPHEDMPARYHSHDLLVFPSIERKGAETLEGCPNVLIEAMAAGLPIVARLAPGVLEVVEHGTTCFGVHSDRPVELARSILALARDPAAQERLRRAGLERVEKAHLWRDVLERTEALLLQARDDARA